MGCAEDVGDAGVEGGATLGIGATVVGDGATAVGDGAVGDTDGRGGAGWWVVESSDTVRTLTTSTIRATIPIPPPKTTRPQSGNRV